MGDTAMIFDPLKNRKEDPQQQTTERERNLFYPLIEKEPKLKNKKL